LGYFFCQIRGFQAEQWLADSVFCEFKAQNSKQLNCLQVFFLRWPLRQSTGP